MHLSQNVLSGKRIYLLGSVVLLFTAVISVAFSMDGNDDFAIARREILLRKIGHELLLRSGDSTSRVLPVKKIAEDEYEISFEKGFTFQSDSLVNITSRLLADDPLTGDYVINVLNPGKTGVTFGFAISKNAKKNILTCSKRKQPAARYTVDIKFKPEGINTAVNGYVLGSLPFLAFVGFAFFRTGKPRKAHTDNKHIRLFTLGSVLFDAEKRQMTIKKKSIDLTGTETRLLLIFAMTPNETIARSRLQKEIWEDEGVIVGRSLDMFISKLRKKLEPDPNIKIEVIRGKGYQLTISS